MTHVTNADTLMFIGGCFDGKSIPVSADRMRIPLTVLGHHFADEHYPRETVSLGGCRLDVMLQIDLPPDTAIGRLIEHYKPNSAV